MDKYLEVLERLETIPEKEVKAICDKVKIKRILGKRDLDGRTKYGTCEITCDCLW